MFNKDIFETHIQNSNSNNIMSAGRIAPFSLNEQGKTNREKYDEYQRQDRANAAKSEVKIDLQKDALKRVVGSPEYANASQEERQKMMDRGMSSVGDDPNKAASSYDDPDKSAAAFDVAQDARAQNIKRETGEKLAAMTPEQRDQEYQRVNTAWDRRMSTAGDSVKTMADVSDLRTKLSYDRANRARIAAPVLSAAKRDLGSAVKDSGRQDPYRPPNPRERSKFILRDQGVNVNDPVAVQREKVRRQVIGGQYRAGMDAFRRSGGGGFSTSGFGSGKF